MENIIDMLNGLTKAGIVALFQGLRIADKNPGIGFDHARYSKDEVIDRLRDAYPDSRILEALAKGPASDRQAPPPTAKARPTVKAEPAPTEAGDEVVELARALAALKGKGATLDHDAVRAIFDEQFDERAKRASDQLLEQLKTWLKDNPQADTVRTLEVKLPDGKFNKVEGYARPELDTLIKRAAARVNQMIVGPAGSGKTYMGHQVADALGLRFASISCTTGTNESHLLGYLLPTAEGGKFEFHTAPFLDMYEHGGVFLFDEIDAADPNVLLVVNQALANGSMFVPQRIGNQQVKKHPDFVCIAAANTWGTGSSAQYTGRERLDEATLDRFRAGRISIDYDRNFEKATCNAELVKWAEDAREKITRSGLRRILSTRFLLDASRLMATGETLEQVKEAFFLGWSSDELNKVKF